MTVSFTALLLCLVSAAFTQNLVFTTGFGSSELMRVTRQRHGFSLYCAILTVFSLLNVLIVFFVMRWSGASPVARIFRPLTAIASAMVLYLIAILLVPANRNAVFNRIHRLLPSAAFNSIVIGFPLFIERQAITDAATALVTVLGCCAGFYIFGILLAEIARLMDHPDIPQAFRGTPAMLLVLGILAMALGGITPPIVLL